MNTNFFKSNGSIYLSDKLLRIHNISNSVTRKKIITDGWKCIQDKNGSKKSNYILYDSISKSDREKYSIPDKCKIEDLSSTYGAISNCKENEIKTAEIKLLLEIAYGNYLKYVPFYYGKKFKIDDIYMYAKTHAVLELMLKINHYGLKVHSLKKTTESRHPYSIMKLELFESLGFL